jgi:hypothetical protein
MHDGSRHFASLPATHDWFAVRDHVRSLPGARLTDFVCDGVTEAWIDFGYASHRFSINDQAGEYLFFVTDPACSDGVLRAVVDHWAGLLAAPS